VRFYSHVFQTLYLLSLQVYQSNIRLTQIFSYTRLFMTSLYMHLTFFILENNFFFVKMQKYIYTCTYIYILQEYVWFVMGIPHVNYCDFRLHFYVYLLNVSPFKLIS